MNEHGYSKQIEEQVNLLYSNMKMACDEYFKHRLVTEQHIVARNYILREGFLYYVSLIYIPDICPIPMKYPYELMIFECKSEDGNYPLEEKDLGINWNEVFCQKYETFRVAMHAFNLFCTLSDMTFLELLELQKE